MALTALTGVLTLALFHLTPLYFIYKPPRRLISWLVKQWPDVLWRVEANERIVALTLDDGPSAYTDEIADILAANDATATFFIIGSHAKSRNETLARLVEAGHELGNHAMHDESSRSLPIEVLREQVLAVQDLIQDVYSATDTKPPPKVFRPGHGWLSASMCALFARLGYTAVLGDVFPVDPQIPFAAVNARHILSLVRPGSVIICHDGRAWTPSMLRIVLPELRRRGYRIVTVSELVRSAQAEKQVWRAFHDDLRS